MKFVLASKAHPPFDADLVALYLFKEKKLSGLALEIDQALGGLLQETLRREDFRFKPGETKLLATHGKIGARYLFIAGLGEREKFKGDAIRRASGLAVRTGNKIRARRIAIAPLLSLKRSPEQFGHWVAEGAVMGNYSFDLYKTKENLAERTITEIEILNSDSKTGPLAKGIDHGREIGEATNYTRDLINTPASDMTPRRMSEEAKKVAHLPHLSAKILDKKEIQKMGMGAFLAVAKGSVEPPYLLHLTYRPPNRSKKRVSLVGKGITFDSGGLSLKSAQSMETMKCDMSGAAAVLGVMRVLSALRPPIEVHGIAAVTENMPSGSADKPGDIARAMTGKTIEILNTDAEGRLTLADAIPYALRQKPDLVIDLATLTGACVVALGELCSGIMGNDAKLILELISSGEAAGERIWQLPLIEEYKEDIKSNVADLKNIGGKGGGTITAGLFIEEFVDPKVPWAHIDIAGPAWAEKDSDYSRKGGTGCMVRTLSHFLLNLAT